MFASKTSWSGSLDAQVNYKYLKIVLNYCTLVNVLGYVSPLRIYMQPMKRLTSG